MSRIEHAIIKSWELAEELTIIMKDRGLSRRQLARKARVGYRIVSSMFHPEWPDKVSKERGSVVIETISEDPQQEFKLSSLAGIAVYRLRGSRRLIKLL
ncbi:MAG: hypothetical protein Q8P74_00265 [bacterium]|nr:hypothetical protein [bacterium]